MPPIKSHIPKSRPCRHLDALALLASAVHVPSEAIEGIEATAWAMGIKGMALEGDHGWLMDGSWITDRLANWHVGSWITDGSPLAEAVHEASNLILFRVVGSRLSIIGALYDEPATNDAKGMGAAANKNGISPPKEPWWYQMNEYLSIVTVWTLTWKWVPVLSYVTVGKWTPGTATWYQLGQSRGTTLKSLWKNCQAHPFIRVVPLDWVRRYTITTTIVCG